MKHGKSIRNEGSAIQFSLEIVVRSYNYLANDDMNSLEGIYECIKEERESNKNCKRRRYVRLFPFFQRHDSYVTKFINVSISSLSSKVRSL